MLHTAQDSGTYVISMDLDSTFLNTMCYGAELTEEFVTLAYYCQATGIPFFITTNRSKKESLSNMKRVSAPVQDEEEKMTVNRIYSQTLQYAKEKIEEAGLNVVYCTLLDAGNQPSSVDTIIAFEKKIMSENHNNNLRTIQEQLVSYSNPDEGSEIQQEMEKLKHVSSVKEDHFRWIASRQNEKPIHILHIDDSRTVCKPIQNQKAGDDQLRQEGKNDFDVQSFWVTGDEVGATIFSTILTDVGGKVGLSVGANALLDNLDLLESKSWLLSFSLIRYLIHTSSGASKDHEKIYRLIKKFDALHLSKLNLKQKESWEKLKFSFNREVEQKVVADFFEKYDAEFNKQKYFLRFFPTPFLNSEWPKDPEERKKITIEDIVLHAMKDPGHKGNRTAKILQTDYYLQVEQDSQNLNVVEVKEMGPFVFRQAWLEIRTQESAILEQFYQSRGGVIREKKFYHSQAEDVDTPAVKRNIVNLIEATKTNRLTQFFHFLPKLYSGDRTHDIFQSTFNVDTREEKTSEQIAKELINVQRQNKKN